MADNGRQNCVAGIKVATCIPDNHGAVVIRISGNDKDGKTAETRQITCVTISADKLFLSREECIRMGITNTFSSVGEENKAHI